MKIYTEKKHFSLQRMNPTDFNVPNSPAIPSKITIPADAQPVTKV